MTPTTQTYPSGAPPVSPSPPTRRILKIPLTAGAGPALALAALVACFSLASPAFLRTANLGGVASQLSIVLVIALGMTFVVLLGGIDLSVEGVMASSSLVFVLLANNDRNGNDFGLLAAIAGVLCGSLIGLINGLLHVRLKIPSFMVTLGTGAVGIGVATVLFGGQPPRLEDSGLRVWGGETGGGVSPLFLTALAVFIVCVGVQRYTRTGRYGFVIGGDEKIAALTGINVGRYKTSAFVLSGTLSGLAGVMAASQLGIGDPNIGKGLLFTAITAVVLGGTLLSGGRGSAARTLVGALIVTVLANGLILIGVSPHFQTAVQGIVIVVAVAAAGWSLRTRTRVVK